VLKGDVSATPLSDVLQGLADTTATGCLHIDDDSGDEALVYVKSGLVYAAYVPGRRPQLGARLISSGALAPEALAEALEAQETELQGWRLGELLVHLGYVERPVVEAFVLEQLREAAFDLSRWPTGKFRFRKNEKTRGDVGLEVSVPDLLAEVTRRRSEWEVIAGVVHGAGAVPVLSAGGLASAEMTLDQDQWALLCKVDGERTIAQLARDCGFTTFEAGQIVYALVGAGLLDVEETLIEEPEPQIDADFAPLGAALATAFGSVEPDDDERVEPDATLARISSALVVPLAEASYEWIDEPSDEPGGESEISRLLSPVAAEPEPEPVEPEPVEAVEAVEEPALREDLKSELASLTAALADLPSLSMPASLEPDYPTMEAPEPEPVAPVAPVEVVAEPEPVATDPNDPFGDSLARVSHALSALLGDALPAVSLPEPPPPTGPTPEEIEAARLEAERIDRSRAAAAAELAEAHALAEASRSQRGGSRFGRRKDKAVDDSARAEAERVAAEEAARVEAERVAAEEAARVEAERVAAEEAARAEAERAAAEEAARAEAERAAEEEAARAEAERVAAEEAAQAEAERVAAEEAAEAERVAAEEAAQAEAERLEAARAETERAEQEAARAEIERLAAEEAARAEADRLATEAAEAAEAERAAAEDAERAAAEQEAIQALAEAAAQPDPEPEPEPEPEPAPVPVDTFAVASFLRDLNDDPATDTVETIEEYDEPAMTPADPEPAFANGSRAGLSETAALLRELTSLGLDDEPSNPAASAANAAKPSSQPKEQPKKRKGLFGRG
jgi:hypothetical protein